MILDFNPTTRAFILTLAKGDKLSQHEAMHDYGFDLSLPASKREGRPVLFTEEPYAAATFANHGTAAVRGELEWITRAIEASRAPDSGRHIDTPPSLELWPYQRADVEYVLARSHCLIGDEPGLGKTPTAICVANEIQAQRVLVICPAAIRGMWAERIWQWSTMRSRHDQHYGRYPSDFTHAVYSGSRGISPWAPWTVVSWDIVRNPGVHAALMAQEFDLIILDEVHYAKNHDSARARAVLGAYDGTAGSLVSRAPKVVALSGTPMPNRPRECYTVARALDWQSIAWMSEDRFNERFNPSRRIEVTKASGAVVMVNDERSGRHAELQNRLRANFMVRHLKADVWKDRKLPTYDLIRVDETVAVKQALEAERLLDIDPDSLAGADMTVLGNVAEARRMMGIAMAPQVADYVKMLVNGGENKLVVFAWHISVLDILQTRLHSLGVLRVDGATSARSKEAAVRQFQSDPRIRIILGNVLSLGTGTDGLQSVASHALIAEPSWVPGENQQCIDRLDRGGQTRSVQADIFVAPGSISEYVLAAALRKGQTVHQALDRKVA